MLYTKINHTRDSTFSRQLLVCHTSLISLASITWRQLVTKTILDGWEFIGLRDGMSFIIFLLWRNLEEVRIGLTDSLLNIQLYFTTGLSLSFTFWVHLSHTISQSRLKSMPMRLTMDSSSKMLTSWRACQHPRLPRSTMRQRLSCLTISNLAEIQDQEDQKSETFTMCSSTSEMTRLSISRLWLLPRMSFTWRKILSKWAKINFRIFRKTMQSIWSQTHTTWLTKWDRREKKLRKQEQQRKSK